MPYQKNVIQVKVPKNSGANMSHRNSGSLTCGTLTPLLVEEVIPGTKCSLKIPEVVQLPPLASDTYMNVKVKREAFFVPMRLCTRSFEDWFSDYERLVAFKSSGLNSTTAPVLGTTKAALPVFRISSPVPSAVLGSGTLLDYLGCKCTQLASGESFDLNPLPLIAYHLIWQEWYRQPRVQAPAFVPLLGTISAFGDKTNLKAMNMLDIYYHHDTAISGNSVAANNIFVFSSDSNINTGNGLLADGTSIFALRQRNFGLDYFTGARVSPQQGIAPSVTIALPDPSTYDPTDPSTSQVGFTIPQLRGMNSLAMFRERNNLPSPRMVDQVKARYGVNLADGIAQRPIFIGSSNFDIVTRGVDQTADGTASSNLQNPFSTIASQYGRAFAAADGTLIDYFEAKEPGFVFVLQSLVPEVTYATGIAPYLTRYTEEGSIVEMANSILQNIGDEPILKRQLINDPHVKDVFAYQDRYGTFMFHPNEAHGLLQDGQSLDSFVLKRSFGYGAGVSFNTAFLEIPKNYLDEVFAVSSGVSGLSAWYDAKLDWKISLPLAEFSIPSLQDPAYEHGETVNLIRNGQVF